MDLKIPLSRGDLIFYLFFKKLLLISPQPVVFPNDNKQTSQFRKSGGREKVFIIFLIVFSKHFIASKL